MTLPRITVCLAALVVLVACQDKKAAPAGASSATATPTAAATLKPQATPIKAGQPFTVAWTGPNGPDDYVDVVAAGHLPVGDEMAYVKTAAGNPAKLTAPATAGTYDVRYVRDTGSRAVVSHVAITVTP